MATDVIDLAQYTGGDKAASGQSLPLLTLDQLREQAKAVKWLVKHVVPLESMGVVFGGSGTFKSFIAIDMALTVSGVPFTGTIAVASP